MNPAPSLNSAVFYSNKKGPGILNREEGAG